MTVGGVLVDRIAHRDLRNQSAEILRRVARGESFEITNHGQVVAVIRPPSADDVWEAVVADFVARAQPGGLRITINDGGARPDTVSLRLLQGARLMEA